MWVCMYICMCMLFLNYAVFSKYNHSIELRFETSWYMKYALQVWCMSRFFFSSSGHVWTRCSINPVCCNSVKKVCVMKYDFGLCMDSLLHHQLRATYMPLAYVIMIVTDVLALNRCQAVSIHWDEIYCVFYVTWSYYATCISHQAKDWDSEVWERLLTHWGRVTHICVGNLTIIGSDNGLSPCRRQAIIWTSAGILLIGPSGTNFREILIEIHTFSFKKMHLKVSSANWRPFCLGLNVLNLMIDSIIERDWEVSNPLVSLLLVCLISQSDNAVCHCINGLVQDSSFSKDYRFHKFF